MKNNKGFTIIEVIICLCLIILISGTMTAVVLTKNKNNKKHIQEVTKKIQEAASVYLSINKDNNNSIEQNIYNGGTGYVIPLKTLINEGYITESYIDTLEKYGQDVDKDKDYMLAGVFSETNMCDNGESTITIKASYQLENNKDEYYLCNFTTKKLYVYYDLDGGYFKNDEKQVELFNEGHALNLKNGNNVVKDKTSNTTYKFKEWRTKRGCEGSKVTSINNTENNIIYACYDTITTPQSPTFITVVESTKFTNNFDKMAVSEEWCKNNPNYDKNKIVCNENGIYTYYDQNSGITYYYARGAINNNYLKFKDKIWRIMWISNDKKMKLVLDNEIQIKINNKSISTGETLYHVTDSKVVKNVTQDTYNNFTFFNRNSSTNLNFWYLSSNTAESISYVNKDTEKKWTTQYRITYDLSKTINVDEKFYTYNTYTSYYNSYSQYNKNYNIFYKYMYDNANYNENYIFGLSEFCYPKKIQRNSTTTFSYTCDKNLNNYSSTYVTKNSKVTYVTLDELKMAGVGTYLDGVDSLDTYILPKNNNSFYLAEFYEDYDTYDTDRNYSVLKNGFKVYDTFKSDTQICNGEDWYSDGTPKYKIKEYYVFYKNGICGSLYCATSWICSRSKKDSYSGTYHAYDRYNYNHNKISEFKFGANAVKPAIIIDLNKIKLSNTNSGTKEDPYTLTN